MLGTKHVEGSKTSVFRLYVNNWNVSAGMHQTKKCEIDAINMQYVDNFNRFL